MATRYSDDEPDKYRRRYPDSWERDIEDRPRRFGDGKVRNERGFVDRATDEVRSWVGDRDAERRRRLDDSRYWRAPRRFGDLRAGDLMTCDVATVHPSDSIEMAARLMRRCDCGALPVTDSYGRLLGMISDRDITVRIVARGIDPRIASVRDFMTSEGFACGVNDSVEGCLRQLERHRVRRVPIVDEAERVVGIISQGDIARLVGMGNGRGERRALADTVSAISEPINEPYR
ncbi:MAG TPA: CBS domain-containing protein [Blastocatellia bacterium]|nr:CBS domain-containing protein [Blastocatellia bacterium]